MLTGTYPIDGALRAMTIVFTEAVCTPTDNLYLIQAKATFSGYQNEARQFQMIVSSAMTPEEIIQYFENSLTYAMPSMEAVP